MIINLAQKLPEGVKKPLRYLYYKSGLGIKWDEDLIKHLSEYFSLDRKQVIFYLKKSRKLNIAFWKLLNPKKEREIKSFYFSNPYYVFSLAYWHMHRTQKDFREKVMEYAQGRVLDYGAGIGDLCLELAKKGLSVTYADLGGKTFDFAQWLFKKYNLPIPMIDLNKESLAQEYDTIICIDVIEHVINPKALLKELSSHLKIGGSLIITNLQLDETTKNYPMHFKINFDAEKCLESLGFKNKEFPWLWKKY